MPVKESLHLESDLESSHSMQISLEAIRSGEAGLTERRFQMLVRVPDIGDFATFPKDNVSIKDLAYLSAFVQHEFALLRGKNKDILFHGDSRECAFPDELEQLLVRKSLRLVAHSHPDYGIIIPSKADKLFLKKIDQEDSVIVSWITGRSQTYSRDDLV